MADNFTTNPGSGGSVFAADDVGGVLVPRVKVTVGSDGVSQDGWTPKKLISAASNNATLVKSSNGQIGFIYASNLNANVSFLKLYDKASSPVVGTDFPIATLPIPGSNTGAGFVLTIPGGVNFANGISLALTTGVADANTGNVAANEVIVFLGYA